MTSSPLFRRLYYSLKPQIPRSLQIFIHRALVAIKRPYVSHIWPIDPASAEPPSGWTGWPDGKDFAIVLMHDVETQKGHDNCQKLMAIEKEIGFRSSFSMVPERYSVSKALLREIQDQGFQVCVHGLKHDGKLFRSKLIFDRRAEKINRYIKEWGVEGFTSPSMHHELDWMHALDIRHSTSTFDTDPFEPQSDGVGIIFPFAVQSASTDQSYIELPYTLPQDFTIFVLMREQGIHIWKQKLDWLAQNKGMALLVTHPDYMNFNDRPCGPEEYPSDLYRQFLTYVRSHYEGNYYHVLPSDMARFWTSITALKLAN